MNITVVNSFIYNKIFNKIYKYTFKNSILIILILK